MSEEFRGMQGVSGEAQDAWLAGALSRTNGLNLCGDDGVEKPLRLHGDAALSNDYLLALDFCQDEVVDDVRAQPDPELVRTKLKEHTRRLRVVNGLSLEAASMVCWRTFLDAWELEGLTSVRSS